MVGGMAKQTDNRWPLTLIRRGAKVADDGTRWWQELPEWQTAEGVRSVGYEVVDVIPAPRREVVEEVSGPVPVDGRDQVTSLRLYLSVAGEADLDSVTERIADVLLELGYNAGPGDVDAVITCVPEAPDVAAWSEAPEVFLETVLDDSAFLLIPSHETEGGEAEGPADS